MSSFTMRRHRLSLETEAKPVVVEKQTAVELASSETQVAATTEPVVLETEEQEELETEVIPLPATETVAKPEVAETTSRHTQQHGRRRG